MLREYRAARRVSIQGGAYLAGVLEYLAAEILEGAGNLCTEAKMKVVMPRHINIALRLDDELTKLMHSVTVSQGTKIPHVEEALLPKRRAKKEGEEDEKKEKAASQSQSQKPKKEKKKW